MPLPAIESALHTHLNHLVSVFKEEFADILPYFGQWSYRKHQYLLKSSYVDLAGKVHIPCLALPT